MSSAILLFAAFALLFAAAGLLLWRSAQMRASRERVTRFVASRVAAPGDGVGAAVAAVAAVAGQGAPSASASGAAARANATQAAGRASADASRWRARISTIVEHAMNRAGVTNARKPAALIGSMTFAACLWAWLAAGFAAALAVLVVTGALLAAVLSWRTQQRAAKLVAQLPSFLDGIVRLVVLGNSVPAAFQGALQTTEAPLRECLDHVSRLLRTGVEIDRALHHVARIYHATELELVGAVLRLSVRYGGRADVMLERMAIFMRDLEQAQRELVAMSAETRISACVLALMPLVIAGFLVVVNPKYFAAMWDDSSGRHFIFGALALQAVGVYLLYRLTRLRSTP